MFSIMITDESTTMPKSTAPSEIRFAEVPVSTRERMHGRAKISALRDGYRIILEILRMRLQ